MATPCLVCEESRPISPNAIRVQSETLARRAGSTIMVPRPQVEVDKCVGCGICKNVRPVQDRPAVYVTDFGETRSRSNQIRLESGAYR
jgi:ferredoxin